MGALTWQWRPSMLHINNGESIVRMFPDAGLAGETLAWQGVLHPELLNLEALSAVRARYLGDAVFRQYLQNMASAPQPLIETVTGSPLQLPARGSADPENRDQRRGLTETGEDVLAGRQGWLQVRPVDRWLGGVHLLPAKTWRWDTDVEHLVGPG